MKSTQKAIVVGSGIAGLAAAIRLAAKGYNVHIFEANAYAGGKLSEVRLGGYRFDAGPSLFTMPHYVDELFSLAGKNPRHFFNYIKKEVVCNYFWDDGQTLTAFADKNRFAEAVAEAGLGAKKDVLEHLEHSSFLYNKTHEFFLERSLHKLNSYTNPKVLGTLAAVHKLGLLNTLHKENSKRFSNPKMVQLFDRYATYNGSSPYLAPGVMQIIPHLEYNVGAFLPKGGMHDITKSLVTLAQEMGIVFHLQEKVTQVDFFGNRAAGIKTEKGEYAADLVVMNADIKPAYNQLMPALKKPKKQLEQEPSSSALIFYWGIKKSFSQLDLHNIFFSNNYEAEFDFIFKKQKVFDDPTVYINITSKDVPSDAPEGSENWFVLVNVPFDSGQNWDEIIPRTRKNILHKVSAVLDENIEALIEVEDILEPRTIQSRTSSFGGALYGSSSNNMFSAFLRHPNFSRQSPNLFFCGGSVHPGGGIPLCLLSAKIVSDLAPNPI